MQQLKSDLHELIQVMKETGTSDDWAIFIIMADSLTRIATRLGEIAKSLHGLDDIAQANEADFRKLLHSAKITP